MSIVPKQILDQHVAILGKTRSGKSSVMRLLVEGLLEQQQPVCIVDPKGDWWGIKLAADGKHSGYPVVIFGGDHADIPINEHAGAHVAELFATGNRPCLIDLGGWMVGPRTRFWIEFASTLFKFTKGQRWLAVDEIHNFAPKGKVFDAEAGKALHWTNRLASEGLGKGVAMLFASQRPQKVHNDTLTSAETLIAMRVLHPSDRGAVADWIKGCGDSEGSEVLNSLAQMERGEGWVWSPEIGFGPKRVKFPLFTTYDSFRPQSVEDTKKLKGWAEVDLEDVKVKMAATIEKAKADDPKELRRQIADLKKQLSSTPVSLAPERKAVSTPVLTDADRALLEKLTARIAEVASLHHEDLVLAGERLKSALQLVAGEYGAAVLDTSTRAQSKMQALFEAVSVQKILRKVAAVAVPPNLHIEKPFAGRPGVSPGASSSSRPHTTAVAQRETRGAGAPSASGNSDLGKGERVTLTAIAQYPAGVTREQLTILTGYTRSSRNTFIQRLGAAGFIDVRGERIVATAAGLAALGDFDPLPTGSALGAYWLARLSGGEQVILRALIDAYPSVVDREALSETTGYTRSSRNTYLQRLGARQLIVTDRNGVRASEELFD